MKSQIAFGCVATTLWVLILVLGRFEPAGIAMAAPAEELHEPPGLRIIYVDDDADGDGSSWMNAQRHLQDALAVARTLCEPIEIRVAQGVYRPDRGIGQVAGDCDATFALIDAVVLLGGYAGVLAVDPDLRDLRRHESILSGDLLGNDAPAGRPRGTESWRNRSDNSCHVVTGVGIGATTILDGFTITGGTNAAIVDRGRLRACGPGMYLDAGSPTLKNCWFEDNRTLSGDGGALFCFSSSRPSVIGCTFVRNSAGFGGAIGCVADSDATIANCLFSNNLGSWGGAVCSQRSGPQVSNCIFTGNLALRGGGALCFWDEDYGSITNCTFQGNDSQWQGGAIWSARSLASLPNRATNCILWGNSPEEILTADLGLLVSHCCVKGGWPGQGNLDGDPVFANPGHWAYSPDSVDDADPRDPNAVWLEGDYHLRSRAGRWDRDSQGWVRDDITSPCVDAGDPNTPVADEPLPNGGRINMGAYGGTSEASQSGFVE